MKPNLSKFVGASVIALSVATLPVTLPASAQTGSTTTEENTTTQETESANTGDRDFDWGWLGLIGLAGLAGLARKHEEPTRYRDPGTAGSTTYRE